MSARDTALPAPESGSGRPGRHIILVGLPGAGKSTVGPRLAARLGWTFHDIDAEIERREGRSITELFAEAGEAAFREIETSVTRELLAGAPSVIAAGGGWVVTDGNFAAADNVAVIVHLAVTPETAASRLSRGAGKRPLLAHGNVLEKLAALELHRRERYARADVVVQTEGVALEEVATRILPLIVRSAE